MKDERNVRHHRAAGARWRPAALLLAAVLIATSLPFFGKSVFAADPEPENTKVDVLQPCSLTVECSGVEMQEKGNLVVDLYRVAYLEPVDMYDTYRWRPTDALSSDVSLPEDTNSEDWEGWKAVTEVLVEKILGTAPEGQTQWAPSEAGGLADSFTPYNGQFNGQLDTTSYKITGVSLGETVENIPSGFYVIIARGINVDKYVCTHEPDGSDSDKYMTKTVTLATSEKYTYQFAAEMIALPTKDKEGENGEPNTANSGEWIYDFPMDSPVVLKPEIRGRGGTLEIIKNLELYEYRRKEVGDNPRDIKDNATFVFEVTAYENEASYEIYKEAARTIYHNFVSINYKDENGIKKAIVEDLPVGAYVVVKEVYSGRSYTATVDTETTQFATIQPDETASVTFKNEYDKRQGGGGSFVNNFKYTEENGWEGNRVKDNSVGANYPEPEVVKSFNKD